MLFNYQSYSPNLSDIFVKYITNNQNVSIFHIITSGHYWRNSQIKELQLIHINHSSQYEAIPSEIINSISDTDTYIIKHWTCESEEDEYDLLQILSRELEETDALFGYNSNSFHLPYLKNKYNAYNLTEPFSSLEHIDLLKEFKTIGSALNLSLKLSDLRLYFKIQEDASELFVILESLQILQYQNFFLGNFRVNSVIQNGNEIITELNTPINIRHSLRLNHPAFYLILDSENANVLIRLFDGKLRVYYSNYEDYFFLPDEDMIIHKSMASGISKEKKVKATYETCYQKVLPPKEISIAYIEKYLKMLFRYIYQF